MRGLVGRLSSSMGAGFDEKAIGQPVCVSQIKGLSMSGRQGHSPLIIENVSAGYANLVLSQALSAARAGIHT